MKTGFWIALFDNGYEDGYSTTEYSFSAGFVATLKILKKIYRFRKKNYLTRLTQVRFYTEPGRYNAELSKEMIEIFRSHIDQDDFRNRTYRLRLATQNLNEAIAAANAPKKSVFHREEPVLIKRRLRERRLRNR